MEVKIKKLHRDAVIPKKAHTDDAGLDLVAVTIEWDENGCAVYGTGLAFEIPKGYVGLVFPRSSNAKKDLILSNSVGVIDSGYRGEVTLKFFPTCQMVNPLKVWWAMLREKGVVNFGKKYAIHNKEYNIGDRVGQLIIMPYPEIEFKETDELSETERGTGGYGSSGR